MPRTRDAVGCVIRRGAALVRSSFTEPTGHRAQTLSTR